MNKNVIFAVLAAAFVCLGASASEAQQSAPPDEAAVQTIQPAECIERYNDCREESRDIVGRWQECNQQLRECRTPATVVTEPDACEQSCRDSGGRWDGTRRDSPRCHWCPPGKVLARDHCHCVTPRRRQQEAPTGPTGPVTPPVAPTGPTGPRGPGHCPEHCPNQASADENVRDMDCDGIPDKVDNCISLCNPIPEGKDRQTDLDRDGIGAACDDDGIDREAREQIDWLTERIISLEQDQEADRDAINELRLRLEVLVTVENVDQLRAELAALRDRVTALEEELRKLRTRFFNRITFGVAGIVFPRDRQFGLATVALRLLQLEHFALEVGGGIGSSSGGHFAGAFTPRLLYLVNDSARKVNWTLGAEGILATAERRPFDEATFMARGGGVAADVYFRTGNGDPMITLGASVGLVQFGEASNGRSNNGFYGSGRLGITFY